MRTEQDVANGVSPPPLGLFTTELGIGGSSWTDDDEWPGSAPPGPAEPPDLGAALGLPGQLRVCARARSQDLARELSVVHEISEHYRRRGSEFAADEVGSALGWSLTMAAQWLELARDVIDRLPALHAVLRGGELDEIKVRTLAEQTRAMPDDLAREVTARVLPAAAEITVSTLIDVIGSVAAALDPDWAARRERAARQRVRVVGTRNPTGTTDVSIRDLHPAHGVAVMARVDALAGALRRAAAARGVRPPIHAVRALVSVRLQDGSCVGLGDDELLEQCLDQLPEWLREHGLHDPEPDDPGLQGPGPDGPEPDDPWSPGPGPDDPGPHDPGPHDPEPDATDATVLGPDGDDADRGARDGRARDGSARDGSAHAADDPADAVAPRGDGRVRAGTAELRMRLSTALGLDELPGQLPSWGTLTAPAACDVLARARDGSTPCEWRLVLVDANGHLEHVMLVHPGPVHPGSRPHPRDRPPGRPPDPPPGRPPDRSPCSRRHATGRGRTRGRMIVELAAATTTLAALDPDVHPAWASWIRRAQARLAGIADDERPGGAAHPATSTTGAHQRRPGRELDRWVRARDRHCIGPVCTRASHSVDLDHTRDWIEHGHTVADNLGGPCRHCHRLKHEGGWRLAQPEPGRFQWRTLLGASHTVPPRPVLDDLPAPAPRRDGRPRPVLDVGRGWDDDEPPWIDRSTPRLVCPAEVPTPRRPASGAADDPADRARPDVPPF